MMADLNPWLAALAVALTLYGYWHNAMAANLKG